MLVTLKNSLWEKKEKKGKKTQLTFGNLLTKFNFNILTSGKQSLLAEKKL